MKNIKFGDKKYTIEREINHCFCYEEIESLMTDYFYDFDYILGDYSYDKLRLKGFCHKKNSRFKEFNDISKVDQYIEDYCGYKANYFLLKKVD